MDAERALVSKVAQTGEIEKIISRGIDPDHFADDECREVYHWIERHVHKYKTPPSMKAVKEKHKAFEFELTEDSIEYLMDRFIVKVKRRMANAAIIELSDAAEDDRAEEIDIHFLDVSRQLATIVPSTSVAKFSDMNSRIDQYQIDKKEGNIWGIKMGIPQLDSKTFGIQPHELIVCAGWQGRGKSTLMQFIAFNAYLQGKRVLFISLEMEKRALLRKFDTMAVDMSYRELKGLELTDDAIDRWQAWADKVENEEDGRDILIVDRIGKRSAMGIFAETVRHEPDLVVVDYISLLEAPRGAGEKSWQQIGHISRELKLNARTLGIPVIAAAQTNRESTKEGVKLETIAFSSSIGMDADIVLGLNQTEEQHENKEMEVVMVKNRDGAPGKALLGWELDRMQIGERPDIDSNVFRRHRKGDAHAEEGKKKKMSDDNPFRRD